MGRQMSGNNVIENKQGTEPNSNENELLSKISIMNSLPNLSSLIQHQSQSQQQQQLETGAISSSINGEPRLLPRISKLRQKTQIDQLGLQLARSAQIERLSQLQRLPQLGQLAQVAQLGQLPQLPQLPSLPQSLRCQLTNNNNMKNDSGNNVNLNNDQLGAIISHVQSQYPNAQRLIISGVPPSSLSSSLSSTIGVPLVIPPTSSTIACLPIVCSTASPQNSSETNSSLHSISRSVPCLNPLNFATVANNPLLATHINSNASNAQQQLTLQNQQGSILLNPLPHSHLTDLGQLRQLRQQQGTQKVHQLTYQQLIGLQLGLQSQNININNLSVGQPNMAVNGINQNTSTSTSTSMLHSPNPVNVDYMQPQLQTNIGMNANGNNFNISSMFQANGGDNSEPPLKKRKLNASPH